MYLNWWAEEYLLKQQQLEIERSAREAWKWKEPKEGVLNQLLWRRQPTNTIACCAPSCC